MERDIWERERAAPDAGIDWMRALADRFRAVRRRHPEDALMIVFDIDGTILDMRHMVRHVLIAYDGAYGTDHFTGLNAEDIRVHENHVDRFLSGLKLPEAERRAIHAWYLERRWAPESILASHRPYRGVMEVIRWFMLQPRTHVGLNTGRPEPLREDTLRSLNALGREYRVAFDPSLLEMNARGWERQVAEGKAAALARFRARGYRVFAVVDNEPGNIARMIEADEEEEILFLHADTIFLSQAAGAPRTVSGQRYALANLISERDIRERVTLVWHGINDAGNLRQFLASSVHWGECDVRRDPRGRLVSRHDSFERSPWRRDEPHLPLDRLLHETARHGKAIKLDLKEGGETVERVLERAALHGFGADRLWFNGEIGAPRESDFRRLAAAVPDEACGLLRALREWGIGRFSIGWRNRHRAALSDCLESLGYEINIYGVPDLESFLQAALMLPCSLTADFNFPAWHYYGRGSGEERAYHHYDLRPPTKACPPADFCSGGAGFVQDEARAP